MWSCSIPSRHLSHPSCGLWLTTITQCNCPLGMSPRHVFASGEKHFGLVNTDVEAFTTTEAFLFTFTQTQFLLVAKEKSRKTGASRKTTLYQTCLQEIRFFLHNQFYLMSVVHSNLFIWVFSCSFNIICRPETKIPQILATLQINISWLTTEFNVKYLPHMAFLDA